MNSTTTRIFLSTLLVISFCITNPINAKKKKKTEPMVEKVSDFKKITGNDTIKNTESMDVIAKGDTFYLQLPVKLLGRSILVTNKLQKTQGELTESGTSKGVRYEKNLINFEWDKQQKSVLVRQIRQKPEVEEGATLTQSVKDNYIDAILTKLKVDAISNDSTTLLFKINNLFDGKENCLNDVFNEIDLGSSVKTNLSRIISIKAFGDNVTAISELTTTVTEGRAKINITVVCSSTLTLLPEQVMQKRKENQKVGFFSIKKMFFSDKQQELETNRYVTRWRLEPKDEEAYLRGELTEPKKPIVFYLDPAIPDYIKPYIKKGILDWNVAFEKAGFKDAIEVRMFSDSLSAIGDDMGYSVLTYDASSMENAMGPSVVDPRSGEILEADIVWWHNLVNTLREWIVVQTAIANPEARTFNLPEEIIGDAARFVACHECGHSLGLRHNMRASSAVPTDSLRNENFMKNLNGTAYSIMDYARFNYVAQQGESNCCVSPHIGPYDMMAIEWGYRWFKNEEIAKTELYKFLEKHNSKEYQFSEQQSSREAVDPRSLSEDLGDDAMLSASYSINNMKKMMPMIVDITAKNEPGQSYDDAAKLYKSIIFQWSLYTYHVLANIGGIYLENTCVGDNKDTYTFVQKDKQKKAVQFLIDELFTYPKWLFSPELSKKTYILRNTPVGVYEEHPDNTYKSQVCFVLWDLLANSRMSRMQQNEQENGTEAFSIIELIDMLHKNIFKTTIKGNQPNLMERFIQKAFVDALITSAAESEGVKINKNINSTPITEDLDMNMSCYNEDIALTTDSRTIYVSNIQACRCSDVLSVKRSEMKKIMSLLKQRIPSSSLIVKAHYEDVISRIQTALG
ncbi:MAG: zinc-dependent metalloprotease, partial [Prevotellaceae bacterium]|nr:zinc-dependent metalloprotease [Candidatus Faecinaster equi]